MSNQLEGKLNLKCSLELLRRALIKAFPAWEKHIQVNPAGLPVYGYAGRQVMQQEGTGSGKEFKAQILIPGPKNPNFTAAPGNNLADIGLTPNGDGTWKITADADHTRIESIEGAVKFELLRMRSLAWAKLRGGQVTEGGVGGKDEGHIKRMRLEVDKDEAKRFLASA